MHSVYTAIIAISTVFILLSDLTQSYKPCELRSVNRCLSGYVQSFVNASNSRLTEIKLHCKVDKELALCTDKSLDTCSGDLLRSLGRAVLSYIRFDRQNGVCVWPGYYPLMKKVSIDPGKKRWEMDYDRLAYRCAPSWLARLVDIHCIKAFVKRMRVNPDLCRWIPFKYKCLQRWQNFIQADVLDALLNIFPREADKVLDVLCTQK